MRIPSRKPGKYSNLSPDPNITQQKKLELETNLAQLKKKKPHAAKEVQRLAELGDFSENAEYQLAKGRLRGINRRILEIEDHLKRAIVISVQKNINEVQLGDTVTIKIDDQKKTYTILGPTETNPAKSIISHLSPIGSALIGKKPNDTFPITVAGKTKQCTIISKH